MTICEFLLLLGIDLSVFTFEFILWLPKHVDLFLLILLPAGTNFPFLILLLFHIIYLFEKAVE